jgi:hypothetical protein
LARSVGFEPTTPRFEVWRSTTDDAKLTRLRTVRARLAVEGAEPLPSTPAEYGADIDPEETQWSKVVKASGAKAE